MAPPRRPQDDRDAAGSELIRVLEPDDAAVPARGAAITRARDAQAPPPATQRGGPAPPPRRPVDPRDTMAAFHAALGDVLAQADHDPQALVLDDLPGAGPAPVRVASPAASGAPTTAAVQGATPASAPARVSKAPLQLGAPGPAAATSLPSFDDEPRLALDLDAAGLDTAPHGDAARPGSAPAASPGGASAAPVAAAPRPPWLASQPPEREPWLRPLARPRLLGSDPLTIALGALAIGVLLGQLPAREVARRYERDHIAPLEVELAQVVERPLAVRAGELRPPQAVQADLEVAYAELATRYWAYWWACALPLALVVGLVPRPRG